MWRNIIVFISFSLLVAACGTLGKAAGPDFVAPTPTTTNWQTYTSAEGKFSIAFPPDYTLYQNQVPSIDGVLAEVPNSMALQRLAEPGFVLSIIYRPTDGTLSAAELAALDDTCVAGTPGQSLALGGQTFQTLLYKDTSCGPHGSTLIYVNSGAMGYRIAIEALAGYQSVVADVNPILDTLLFRVSD